MKKVNCEKMKVVCADSVTDDDWIKLEKKVDKQIKEYKKHHPYAIQVVKKVHDTERVYFCCSKCFMPASYDHLYDRLYCELCNEWLEAICGSKTCDFCKDRPKKPSMVNK